MTVCRNNEGKNQKRRIWVGVIVLFLLFAAASAWKWTPLADLIDVHRLSGWATSLRQSPVRHFYLLGAYVIGSILLVPITVMILVTAIVFGPVMGSLYSIVGSLLGAAVTYAICRLLGQDFLRKTPGAKWRRFEQKIRLTGIVPAGNLPLVPVDLFYGANRTSTRL